MMCSSSRARHSLRAEEDHNVNVYDARVCEASDRTCAESKETVSETPSCSGEECRNPPPRAPTFALPATGGLFGQGNLTPPPPISGGASKPLTNRQKLAKALGACRAKVRHVKRKKCEKEARAKYGPRSKKAVRKR